MRCYQRRFRARNSEQPAIVDDFMNAPTIIFIPVNDNTAKLQTICNIAHTQLLAEKSILITVPNMQAAQYVDSLLWRLPEESFLPHCYTENHSTERCVITTKPFNWNKATVLLNLCPDACPIYKEFELVYELWDQTDAQKASLSAKRKAAYGL